MPFECPECPSPMLIELENARAYWPIFDYLTDALAGVPPELMGHGLLWGTPEQVADQLRAFGQAGVRHVVLVLASAMASRQTAIYGLRATRKIARLLRNGRERP